MNSRNKRVGVRFNEKEYAHLKRQAEKSGLSMEALIRLLVMGVNIKPIPPDEIKSVLYILSNASNNINQIARLANSTKAVSQTDITEIKTLLFQIMQRVKSI